MIDYIKNSRSHYGLIAQEVEEIEEFRQIVNHTKGYLPNIMKNFKCKGNKIYINNPDIHKD